MTEPEPAAAGDLGESQVRIVRAAYRLVSERGVHRVSLEDIAGAAGVSKGLVLYHFHSRENLLLVMMRWILDEVASRIRQAVDAAATPREQVAAMLDVVFAGAESNRRFYLVYLEIVEHAARFERFGRLSSLAAAVQDATYAAVIQAGIASGDFRDRPIGDAVAIVRGSVEGLFLRWLQDGDWRRAHARYRALAERSVLDHLVAR